MSYVNGRGSCRFTEECMKRINVGVVKKHRRYNFFHLFYTKRMALFTLSQVKQVTFSYIVKKCFRIKRELLLVNAICIVETLLNYRFVQQQFPKKPIVYVCLWHVTNYLSYTTICQKWLADPKRVYQEVHHSWCYTKEFKLFAVKRSSNHVIFHWKNTHTRYFSDINRHQHQLGN